MATLEKIRNNAKWLLIGFVGLALFAFVFDGFFRSGSTFFRQKQGNIAVIDGQSISILDFQTRLEISLNNYKSSMGPSISDEQQNQIRQMVFDQMVNTILLENESEKVGFVVGKEELTDLLVGNNISPIIQQMTYFQNPQTKAFDKNSLLQFLQVIESDDLSMYAPEVQQQILTQKEAWLTIEKNVREQKLVSKLSTLLASAVVANSLDAKTAFDDNATSVDFNFVSQLYNSMPDTEVEVSDAEIAKLYELRKNNFKQESAKVIDYIAVNIVPSTEDYADISARIEKLRDEFVNATNVTDIINENSDVPFVDAYVSAAQLDNELKIFVEKASVGMVEGPALTNNVYSMYKLIGTKQAPDSIKVNQVTFSNMDDAKVKSLADSLIQVIKSGKSFADVALDETGGQTNGDMGWQTESSLVAGVDVAFANTLFGAKIGEPFITKSSYGTHLVQVVEKTNPVNKYKIGTINMGVTPSTKTYNLLYNNLNQYISKNHKLETFRSAAQEAGYICQTDVQLLENQSTVASIENSRQVVRWANSHAKGDISEIFECKDYFIAAAMEGTVKAGFRPVKEVSDLLKREIINEKKGAKIVENLKAKNLSSMETYAEAMNTTPQEVKFVTFSTQRITGIGVDPVVNAKALASEPDQLIGPFAGKNGVYVLSLTAKNAGNQTYNAETQKQQMDMQNSYRIMSFIQNNRLLKDNAKIEDNRSRFY